MTLALRLGRTVGELLDGMTAAELLLWRAYDAESPLSDQRGDVHAALIASSVYQSQGGKVSLADLLPRWGGVEVAPPTTWESFIGTMQGTMH